MNSKQVLNREFLEVRAKILEIAASLDRIQRAEGDVSKEKEYQLIKSAIELIATESESPIRAEKIQLLFSREYDPEWLDTFEITSRT